MQVTIDLVDWEWVKTAPNTQFFLEVMLDQDDADLRFGTSCYQFAGGWGDSALLYLEMGDALPLVLKRISTTKQLELLHKGLLPILSHENKVDELGVQAFPEEGYIASASPQKIATMAEACNGLRLDLLASDFDKCIPKNHYQQFDRPKLFEAYLNQWITALKTAMKEEKGMFIHLG